MQENRGTALYVLPICWTDLHARLLGAQFIPRDPVLTPVPATPPLSSPTRRGLHVRPSQTAAAISRELNLLLSPETSRLFCKYRAIKTILSTFYPATLSKPRSSSELDLYFGARVFRKAVRVPVLWRQTEQPNASFDSAITQPAASFGRIPTAASELFANDSQASCRSSQTAPDAPMLAYINRNQLSLVRRHLFRISMGPEDGDRANTPVSRLQYLRSKALFPADVDQDAHFVGILLAMAQAHFYSQPGSRNSSQSSRSAGASANNSQPLPTFREVTVRLLTHDDDAADFIVYSATVSSAFLQRFSEPSKAPIIADSTTEGGIKIDYTRVPIWPILGLKERLGKALGHDIAGDIIEDSHIFDEHCGSQAEEEHQATPVEQEASRNLKRSIAQCETLSEVLTSSFEVRDDDNKGDNSSGDSPAVRRVGSLSPAAKRRCSSARARSLEVC
ncbi:uncharacterized protein E0L32_007640 [Thyridium curvatum]|uniref:Uncharacterized protein n=1 Tax=Thyridium curvatum TaxID=1093900 RepID=A0A507B3N5_9PEZI|nr:uncharacterized protein E0L32_007640 [Thyridium curvatum]TPX11661.1 hypothetical protein E0L32_007640 [Thyridium curvatum]